MDNNQLKKRSRQGAVISSIGFLMVVSMFVYAGITLNNLNKEITERSIQIEALDSLILAQNQEIKGNEQIVASLVEEINKLKDPAIKPKSNAVAIPGIFDSQGRQIYDFTIWLTSSQFTLNRIKKATFKFPHESFNLKDRESSDSSNGFLVSYRGYGTLNLVTVHIEYETGEEETLFYDMHKALSTTSN